MKLSFHILKNQKMQRNIKKRLHKISRDAYVDWSIILNLSFIASAALLIVGYYSFFNMNNPESKPQAKQAQVKPPIFDESALNKVLTSFGDRDAERQSVGKAYTKTNDPTL